MRHLVTASGADTESARAGPEAAAAASATDAAAAPALPNSATAATGATGAAAPPPASLGIEHDYPPIS